jgi:hypothetical protein
VSVLGLRKIKNQTQLELRDNEVEILGGEKSGR